MKEHNAHGIGKDLLAHAIGNVQQIRQDLISVRCHNEAELCYQMISLLMEIDKYFAGGYLSREYIKEKCETITRYGNIIHIAAFGNDGEEE